jgi:hypothetical protein
MITDNKNSFRQIEARFWYIDYQLAFMDVPVVNVISEKKTGGYLGPNGHPIAGHESGFVPDVLANQFLCAGYPSSLPSLGGTATRRPQCHSHKA